MNISGLVNSIVTLLFIYEISQALAFQPLYSHSLSFRRVTISQVTLLSMASEDTNLDLDLDKQINHKPHCEHVLFVECG